MLCRSAVRWGRRGAVVVAVLAWLSFSGGRELRATGFLPVVEGYHVLIPDVVGRPGGAVRVDLQGLHERSVQGFQFVLRYPAGDLTVERIHFEGTIVEAIGSDYLHHEVHPELGFLVVAVLVDSRPPFDGALIPNISRPMPLVHIEARVGAHVEEDLTVRLEDGLSNPPLENLYVVDNYTVPPSELSEGAIRLPIEELPLFVRGDTTMDRELDISDAVSILQYSFSGGRPPRCADAADANDDESLDVSDAVFILAYLFHGEQPPPPPMPEPGTDPAGARLGCQEPLEYLRVRG